VGLLDADAAGLNGPLGMVARSGTPVATLLMSAGFILSSLGAGREEPDRFISLVFLGGASLAAGHIALGAGLLLVD
jgi:hypothetical protein